MWIRKYKVKSFLIRILQRSAIPYKTLKLQSLRLRCSWIPYRTDPTSYCPNSTHWYGNLSWRTEGPTFLRLFSVPLRLTLGSEAGPSRRLQIGGGVPSPQMLGGCSGSSWDPMRLRLWPAKELEQHFLYCDWCVVLILLGYQK